MTTVKPIPTHGRKPQPRARQVRQTQRSHELNHLEHERLFHKPKPSQKHTILRGNPLYTTMRNFRQMEKLLNEGDPARPLEEPRMKVVGTKMSQFPTRTNQTDYNPRNFTHYDLKDVSEQEALKTVDELNKIFYGELPYKLSVLAGYHNNNTILKVYDEFLSNLLTQAGVKV